MANPNPNMKGLRSFASLSTAEMSAISRKGANATNKLRADNATLREQLKLALTLPITDKKIKKECIEAGFAPTNAGNLIRNVVNKAGKNAMMFRTLAEILGELQPQQINVNVLSNATDMELQERMKNITIEADGIDENI